MLLVMVEEEEEEGQDDEMKEVEIEAGQSYLRVR